MTQLGFIFEESQAQESSHEPMATACTNIPAHCIIEHRAKCIWCNPDLYNSVVKRVLGEEEYVKIILRNQG